MIRVNEELVRTQYVIMQLLRKNKATNCIRNLTATSERKLTGSIDFLGDITAEKPKPEKKKSTRDWLFM